MTEQNRNHAQFIPLKHALQAFQSNRLKSTYPDLRMDAQFHDISIFFFDKLYGPEDFSFRNASIKKLHQILDGKVYRGMVSAVSKVIELHDLSDSLDDRMVEEMIENRVGSDMNMPQYQRIYRQLDNYDQRVYQILLSIEVTGDFFRLSQKWIVGASLKTVRLGARLLGIGKIIDFVNEGYQSFRKINDINMFINTIKKRELAWHDETWYGNGHIGEV